MLPFRQCADQFTVILYDHRCNGRSVGAPVSSMTLEYALRYPGSLSHLVLLDTGGDAHWEGKRPEALIFAGRELLNGWTVTDRLGEIKVPTLVLAGRDDGVFPPDRQRELAAGIPHARLHLVDHARHSPHAEQAAEVMAAIRHFITADAPTT